MGMFLCNRLYFKLPLHSEPGQCLISWCLSYSVSSSEMSQLGMFCHSFPRPRKSLFPLSPLSPVISGHLPHTVSLRGARGTSKGFLRPRINWLLAGSTTWPSLDLQVTLFHPLSRKLWGHHPMQTQSQQLCWQSNGWPDAGSPCPRHRTPISKQPRCCWSSRPFPRNAPTPRPRSWARTTVHLPPKESFSPSDERLSTT